MPAARTLIDCVAPVYAGTWQVTADPDVEELDDGSTLTFHPSSFVFEVDDDDDDVVVIDKAASPPIVYEGALIGKALFANTTFYVEQPAGALQDASSLELTFEAGEGQGRSSASAERCALSARWPSSRAG